MTTPSAPAPISVIVNKRTYERNARGRWSYQPANGHKRTSVHPTSRLHHALDALAFMDHAWKLAASRRLALLRAGQILSNTVYNTRQQAEHGPLDARTRESMKQAVDDWDAVR